jgi:hypothetical protein
MNLSWTGHCLARRRYDERLCRDLQLRGWSCRWCCRGFGRRRCRFCSWQSSWRHTRHGCRGSGMAMIRHPVWHVLRGFRVRILELRLLPGKSLGTEHGRLSLRKGSGAIRKISVTVFWVAYVTVAVSALAIRAGHSSLLWTVLQDCGLGLGILALAYKGYYYWRRRRNHV